MNFFQKVIYTFLSLKERGLRLRLDKYLRSSVKNSTSKTVISGNCSLTLSAETNKNIELVKFNMLDVVKNANFTSDVLIEMIKKKNVQVFFIKDAIKLLALLSEEQGLILERRGVEALLLNLIVGNGFSFKTKPMFILEQGNKDFYFLLFHFYKMHCFFQNLPGMDYQAQKLFRLYSRQPEKTDISQLGLDEMSALKEAVARDNEASSFVIEYSKQRDAAKKLLKNEQK